MSDNPYMRRAAARNIGDAGRTSEKRVAKTLGARLQPASGAMASAKGDMKIQRKTKFLAESKSTTADTLKVDLAWLMKVTAEALSQNAQPLLTISFVTPEGKLRGLREDWVCMPRHVFDELTGDE
jgi:hypothetical protein